MTDQPQTDASTPFDNIQMTAQHIPARTDTDDFKDAVHWHLSLLATDTTATDYNFPSQTVMYSEGTGHFVKQCPRYEDRILTDWVLGKEVTRAQFQGMKVSKFLHMDRFANKSPIMPGWGKKALLTPPKLADVLYGLTLDASAHGQTFEEWAGDCGYDTDSMKAKAVYDACVLCWHKLNALGLDLEALQVYFQDY